MLKRFLDKTHIYVALLALLIIGVGSIITMNVSFFDPFKRSVRNFSLFDIYYQIMDESGERQTSPIITIVDASTLFDRSRIAQTINEINACQPAAVGFDVIFSGLRGDTLGSELLREAIAGCEKAVTAMKLNDVNPETGEFQTIRHSFFIPMEGLQEGYSNVKSVALGDIIRRISIWHTIGTDTLHSLSYNLASLYDPNVKAGNMSQLQLIDYSPTTFNVVPYDSVLYHPDMIKDHIVLLGATHDESDMHYSPYGRTAGTIIQAYAVQTMIEHHDIKEVGTIWSVIISLIIMYFTDFLLCEIAYQASRSRHPLVKFLFDSALIKNFINFIWIAMVVWINFIVFTQYNIYFSPTITLLGMAFLVEARLFYRSGVAAYKSMKEQKKEYQ